MNRRFYAVLALGISISLVQEGTARRRFREGSRCDYLIVAPQDDAILMQARRFAEIKRCRGLRTRIVPMDSIIMHTAGVDTPQKIRKTIQHHYIEDGLSWVLLMGDFDLVPARVVYSEQNPEAQPFPERFDFSDVYYSCLDDEWDTDNDGMYGEEPGFTTFSIECGYDPDSVYTCRVRQSGYEGLDRYEDVVIGRLPVSNGREARIIVDKIVAYTNAPMKSAHAADIFLFGARIHGTVYSREAGMRIDDVSQNIKYRLEPAIVREGGQYTDANIDILLEDSITPAGDIIEDSIEVTNAQMTAHLSRGYNLVFIATHGYQGGIQLCSFKPSPAPKFTHVDAAALESSSYSNIISNSCSVMHMMNDTATCFAKSFLTAPRGGAVSYCGSSGGNSDDGIFYRRIFELLATARVNRIARAMQIVNGVYGYDRYHKLFYNRHYWGDPEMEVWSRYISAADLIGLDIGKVNNRCYVSVDPPLDSVLVCLYKTSELFMRGYTRGGVASFVLPASAVDSVVVTASMYDYLPGQCVVNTADIPELSGPPIAVSAQQAVLHVPRYPRSGAGTVYDVLGRRLFRRDAAGRFPGCASGVYLRRSDGKRERGWVIVR